MRPVRAVATFTLALAVVSAPAGAQTDYAGLPAPEESSGTEAGSATPYVGAVGGPDPGQSVAYVGLGPVSVGAEGPSATPSQVRTAVAPSPPPSAGATAREAAAPVPSEDLPPVITGRDIVSLTTLGAGALVAFAVLIGRRRLR